MVDKLEQSIKQYSKWKYHIIWETKNKQEILKEEVAESIATLLEKACNELDIQLKHVQVMDYAVEFAIDAEFQLNINKIMKVLQKKCAKSIKAEVWSNKPICVSINDQLAGQDARIEKLLRAVTEVAYYDLDEMFDEELKAFREHLSQRKLGVVDWGDRVFLIDKEAVSKEINLNCFECTKIYKYGCCSGSPCEMSRKNQDMLKKHLPQIERAMEQIDSEWYRALVASGGILGEDDSIKEWEGRCALLVAHEGVYKCMAHKYALETEIPIYEICPLSCLMYPLEILELLSDRQNRIILLTSVLENSFATKFGRWGSYESLEVDLRCLDKEAHNQIFKKQDYKPVYRVNQGLLTHEFGPQVYKGIEALLREE